MAQNAGSGSVRTGRVPVLSLLLFGLNAWICHRLFTTEFAGLQSNEAAFIAISRFFHDHWNDLRWFPWFDGGMPIENAYQPVLPALTATVSAITGSSVALAFHVVLAAVYCLGPVTLFWLAYDWSESLWLSFAAGLADSLISPSAMLIPAIRVGPAGIWAPQRLYNLVFYGEGPHNLALTLLPLALMFLRRAAARPRPRTVILAIISCSLVALSNAFGAMGLALGALCIVLTVDRFKRACVVSGLIGVAAWLWSSPWLPPSLIETIRRNAWTARGNYNAGIAASAAFAAMLLVFTLVWFSTRRLKSGFERFAWLFAAWMCALPLVAFGAKVTLVPQATRYQSEMELAVCLVFACLLKRFVAWSPMAVRSAAAVALLVLLVHQVRTYRNFAHDLIRPADITKSTEYKVTRWIDRNLPGQRAMVSGGAAYLFNVFSDNPQLSAGHEPTAPNFMQQVAVYTIYSGTNAGDRDGPISVFWLKAFGSQAITVPGPDTREYYRPFAHPYKFEGLLPVLWREDGDTIYAVPRRSSSLAHVIPAAAVVTRQPVHGLDLEPAVAYVNALDDPALPSAELEWQSQSRAAISALLTRGQVISVQVTYDRAWRASSGGRAVSIRKDGLGQMILEPDCNGNCRIDLYYGTTSETWFCRVASGLITLGLILSVFLSPRGTPSRY